MLRLIFLLFMLLTALPIPTHADETVFEPLTPDNARWLIPLVSAQVGSVTEMMWLPDEESVAIQMSTGVWVFPAEIIEDEPVLVMEEGVFYPRLTNLTLNPTRTRLIALEIIPDARPDQPTYAYVWDVAMGEIITELVGVDEINALSPDGQTIAVSDGQRVLLYSLTSGQRTEVIATPHSAKQVTFNTEGRYLAVVGHEIYKTEAYMGSFDLYRGPFNPYLMVYDLSESRVVAYIEKDDLFTTSSPIFTPDNAVILLPVPHGIIQYWQFDAVTATLTDITERAEVLGYRDSGNGLLRLTDETLFPYAPYVASTGISASFVYPTTGNTPAQTTRLSQQIELWRTMSTVNIDPFGTAYLGIDEPMLGLLGLDEQLIGYRADESGIHLQLPSYTLPGYPPPFYVRYPIDGLNLVQAPIEQDDPVVFHIVDRNSEGYDMGVFTSPIFLEEGQLLYTSRGPYGSIMTILDLGTGNVIHRNDLMSNVLLFDRGRRLVGFTHGGYTLYLTEIARPEYQDIHPLVWLTEDERPQVLLAAVPDEQEFAVLAQGIMARWRDGNFVDNGVYAEDLDLDGLLPRTLVYSPDGRWMLALGHDGDGFGGILWRHEYFEILPYGGHIQPQRFTLSGTPETGYSTSVVDEDSLSDIPLRVTVDADRRMRFTYADTGRRFAEFVLPPWDMWVDNIDNPTLSQTPDGALYTTNEGDLGRLYSRETGEVVGRVSGVFDIAFDPQGYTLSAGGQLWGVPASPADPTTVVCEGVPVPRLRVDSQAVITATTGPRSLRLRSAPNGTILDSLPSGSIVQIARGPVCDRGALWWGIETASGQSGWVAEAVNTEDYLLLPTD